jgi:RNA polymerase sigma-70 factor (ECF subfamily)
VVGRSWRFRGAAGRPAAIDEDLAAWAHGAAARDPQAMRQLVLAVGPAMLSAVRRVLGASAADVEDVLQEAAEGLLEALPSFKGDCSVRHFACRVAVFTALAWRRKLSFRAQWMVDVPEAAEASPSADLSPADTLQAARRRQILEMLLDELSPAQAEVLVLHCALDFTLEEVAATVGRPVETVRSRLRLAKQALRERIGDSAALIEILETKR